VKQFLGWAVVAVTVVFVLYNLKPAQIQFLGMTAEMPIAFVVLASALLGALATYTFTSLKSRK